MKHANQILHSLLALSLAAVCSGAVATESGVKGASTTANTSVAGNWATAIMIVVTPDATFPAGNTYYCAVTCTAAFNNTSEPGNGADYYLGIGKNGAVPPSASRRHISFPEDLPGLGDADGGSIATTYEFSGSGSTYFYCQARRADTSGDPTGDIENASITASCSDHAW